MTFENRGACVHRKQTVGCKTSKNKPQESISKASTKDVIKSDETLDLEATTQSKTITSLVRPMALSRATFLATYHRRTGQLCVKRL